MSTVNTDELFGVSSSDGGDTDELLANSNSKPIAKKKKVDKRIGGKTFSNKRVPDADNDTDDGAGALFDSSDDESDGKETSKLRGKKRAKRTKPQEAKPKKRVLSKREKMEALKAKRVAERNQLKNIKVSNKSKDIPNDKGETPKANGYESGDSYESVQFERTEEDDAFIDDEDEDPDALKELHAEQHFDDERPDGEDSDEGEGGRYGKPKSKTRKRGPDAVSDDDLNSDNPIMIAVRKMKKKKREAKKIDELEQIATDFLRKMEYAADEDDLCVKERRPATNKLVMLPDVLEMLTKREMMRPLLESNLLIFAKRWIQPLPNGTLGNVTIRQRLLDSISKMTGEQGITSHDLKKSDFGKVVMRLYMHKSETREMKQQHKALIEQWSRPIFQKSGNMRDLHKVQSLRKSNFGLVGLARAQVAAEQSKQRTSVEVRSNRKDLSSIISKGVKSTHDLGNNRVRVPYSKGFQFTVCPSNISGDVTDRKTRDNSHKTERENLHKKMKKKANSNLKNQRSAHVSVEGKLRK